MEAERKNIFGVKLYILGKQEENLKLQNMQLCLAAEKREYSNCSQKGSAYFYLLASLFIILTLKLRTVWTCKMN